MATRWPRGGYELAARSSATWSSAARSSAAWSSAACRRLRAAAGGYKLRLPPRRFFLRDQLLIHSLNKFFSSDRVVVTRQGGGGLYLHLLGSLTEDTHVYICQGRKLSLSSGRQGQKASRGSLLKNAVTDPNYSDGAHSTFVLQAISAVNKI